MRARCFTPSSICSATRLARSWRISAARRRAVLSLAHQGCRRCRFLHRLGRSRRRADHFLLAGAGLRHRAWLDEAVPRGAYRARRRCRNGRGQHLRGAAGRLEARPAEHWWVIDYNRQSLDAVVRDRLLADGVPVPRFGLGGRHREIRPRSRRRSPSPAATRCGAGSMIVPTDLFGADLSGRCGVAQASAGRFGGQGTFATVDGRTDDELWR